LGARTLVVVIAVLSVFAVSAGLARAQDALLPAALPEGNLVAIGVGMYPDYIGSDVSPESKLDDRGRRLLLLARG
jgi:hypothetical protein